MKAVIVNIGDELLIGQTINTNSAWMGEELTKLGFDVLKAISIHDRRDDILDTLKESEGKTDVLLITGGLGPTSDDITKPTLCEFFNTRLVEDKKVLEMISGMLARRNFPMNENNRRQAEVPESCCVLYNKTGTAPGMWFERSNTIFVSMPGVPHEMKHLMCEYVLPELRNRFKTQSIVHKNIMTYGLPEARLAEILEPFEAELPAEIRLAYLPSSGVIKLRLTATGKEKRILESIVDEQVKKLNNIIPEVIFSGNEESFEMVIGRLLKERNATLCTAESCTGGEIATMITSVAGSSGWYRGSVIAYANEIKIHVLGVPDDLIRKHGAVSQEVVSCMASGCRKIFSTGYSVATSGIAGPHGGTPEKPVGLVWIAVASEKGVISDRFLFGSERHTNIRRFSLAALDMLRKKIIAG